MSKLKEEQLEIEVKFTLSDRAAFRKRLLEVGAAQTVPRTHELNIRLDTSEERLKSEGKLLRLRRDKDNKLTFKGQSEKDLESEARVREELEVGVSSFETMLQIIKRIGFQQSQIYEKYRETFQFNQVEVVIDEMPFGDFVELEGDEAALRTAAEELGLDWRQRILANYLALMEQLKSRYNLSFNDVTFENFTGLNISYEDHLDGYGG